MIDARSRRSWDVNTGNQDVLCQIFGSSSSSSSSSSSTADASLLFSGLRNGDVIVHDLRSTGGQPKFRLTRPNRHLAQNAKRGDFVVTSLKFPGGAHNDGNYIYSG